MQLLSGSLGTLTLWEFSLQLTNAHPETITLEKVNKQTLTHGPSYSPSFPPASTPRHVRELSRASCQSRLQMTTATANIWSQQTPRKSCLSSHFQIPEPQRHKQTKWFLTPLSFGVICYAKYCWLFLKLPTKLTKCNHVISLSFKNIMWNRYDYHDLQRLGQTLNISGLGSMSFSSNGLQHCVLKCGERL